MRITVNLSIFFHDHRSLAKIFINKKMKCIRDVEQHISDIFQIQDFYLKYENQYLPPTEDVQILNTDDIVWAVPVENAADKIRFNDVTPVEENLITEKKKKKKKKQCSIKEELVSSDKEKHDTVKPIKKSKCKSKKREHEVEVEDAMESEDTPIIKKKKKKKKQNQGYPVLSKEKSNQNIDNADNSSGCENVRKKRKLDLHSSPEGSAVKDFALKDSGRDSLEDSSKSDDTPSEGKNINVKSLVHTFENKKINFGKQLYQNINNETERRINIVKTIIITPKTNASDELKSDTLNVQNLDVLNKGSVDPSSNITPVDSNMIDRDVNLTDECKTAEHLSNKETSSSNVSYSTLNEVDVNVNKRRRRRTRRRKHVVHDKKEFNTTFEPAVYDYSNKKSTPLHVRFNENQSTPKDEQVPVTNESTIFNIQKKSNEVPKNATVTNLVNNEPKDSSENEIILIDESISNVHELKTSDELAKTTSVTNLSSTYNEKEIEDCILKQPITRNTEPRLGDVIAFKILRLSDSYTPELSSTIVGKVANYEPENKEISFDVIYGQGQCSVPQGKFSLDEDDHPTEENSKLQCSWSSLLEPRLIFP